MSFYVNVYLRRGKLCVLPAGSVENMESTSLIFKTITHESGWNIDSSQSVALSVGQFRGQVTESKHSGAEIISLMYSLSSFVSVTGGNSLSQQLFNLPLLSESPFHFKKDHGCKNIMKNAITYKPPRPEK